MYFGVALSVFLRREEKESVVCAVDHLDANLVKLSSGNALPIAPAVIRRSLPTIIDSVIATSENLKGRKLRNVRGEEKEGRVTSSLPSALRAGTTSFPAPP